MEKRLFDLPKNILSHTLSFLDLGSLFNFSVTSKRGNVIFKEETLWRLLCLRDFVGEKEEGESWQERYRNSLFVWPRDTTQRNVVSKDGRTLSSISNQGLSFFSKIENPLSTNKIHKCLLHLVFPYCFLFECLTRKIVEFLLRAHSPGEYSVGICTEKMPWNNRFTKHKSGRGMILQGEFLA